MQGETVMLCVHGIQGSPAQFEWIEAALSKCADCVKLTLPGHGGSVRDFRESGMAQWQACVNAAIDDLRGRYDRIIYVGHSMGCLLGMDACLHGREVDALVLLACPLYVRPTWRYVRNNLCAAMGWCKRDASVCAARAGSGVRAEHPLEYLLCGRPYMELFAKMRSLRRSAEGLKVRTVAIHSERDEIVRRRSLDCFMGATNVRRRVVEGCGHYLYTDAARREIIEEIQAVLKG